MDVKKIFIILITIVACVMIGALVLNILLPNVSTSLVDAVEGMITNATGMKFDFNGNGVYGTAKNNAAVGTETMNDDSTGTHAGEQEQVAGFE